MVHLALPLVTFYIGTYTSVRGSQGIYEATLDLGTGALSQPTLAAKARNPSYLALSPHGRRLYAVDESGYGSVASFAVESGKLRPLGSVLLRGSAPAYVSADPGGGYVFTASYVGGAVQCLPVQSDGSLGPATGTIINSGHGPNKSRQEASHMHWVHADPQGRFVYSCDLGTDLVQCYRIVPTTGGLERVANLGGRVPPGSGPRHGAWEPAGRFFYVNGEMGNNVTTFAVDPSTGALTSIQTLSTLPADAHSVGSAEIECHPNGRFIYVSNRGHDSIAVYAIERTGQLQLVQIAPAGVRTPRGFGIDPSGHWLIAAGQDSNDLTALSIDPATGRLGAPGPHVKLGSPVCIVFAGT